jgi:hypothetical protein
VITDEERVRIQAVECPLCHAKPGTNCISVPGGGRFTGFIHRERKAVARADCWSESGAHFFARESGPVYVCQVCGKFAVGSLWAR